MKSISHHKHARRARVAQIKAGQAPIPDAYLEALREAQREVKQRIDRMDVVLGSVTAHDFLRNSVRIHFDISRHAIDLQRFDEIRESIAKQVAERLGVYYANTRR